MAELWHGNGKSMENARISAFSNVAVILCYSQKIIVDFDAQYAKKFGKFFGLKIQNSTEIYYNSTTEAQQK